MTGWSVSSVDSGGRDGAPGPGTTHDRRRFRELGTHDQPPARQLANARAHLPYDVSRGSHANQLQAADIRVCCCMYNSQRIQVAHQLSYAPIPIAVPSSQRHHFHISLHSLQASLLPQIRCVFTPRDTQQPASAATNTIKSAFAPVCNLGLRKTSQIIQILFATKHHQSSVTS